MHKIQYVPVHQMRADAARQTNLAPPRCGTANPRHLMLGRVEAGEDDPQLRSSGLEASRFAATRSSAKLMR
jgi:hypothetical protein